jgi:regulator of cell morphogenesis and NO signaling
MNQDANQRLSQSIDLSIAVGSWVREFPQTSRLFERLGIDYCCGGKQSLADACQLQILNREDVAEELRIALSQVNDGEDEHFKCLSMTEMCNEIVKTHHDFLKTELPRLASLMVKVQEAHGAKYDWLSKLEVAFKQLSDELMPHMFKEEHILFPAIRSLEQSGPRRSFPFGSIDNPIHMMEREHAETGAALEQIRELTSNFAVPNDACNTFRALVDGLRELQIDLHRHIHKENNILFPLASEMAASRKGVA